MTYPASARGGYLLNSGYLSTSGSQIIDSAGNPVRIASIGWNNGDSLNFVPDGMYAAAYTTIIDTIKASGFNTIRLPYCDLLLTAGSVPNGQINYSLGTNSALSGKTPLQVMDAIIAYAGSIGLKIIIDHHNNEGANNGWGGQQGNGLWFDSGPGSNGTDGNGHTGTITDAKFQSNWVMLASRYANNSTVIGFDLDNEPLAYPGMCTWGDGSATDIHAMYQRTGNAVLAVNPNLLIICEGPQNYNNAFVGNFPVPCGDLTAVPTKPVVLNVPNKVVYSLHIYPAGINGITPDSGSGAITNYNNWFGFLYTKNIAPVFIGEMGASLDGAGPDSTGNYSVAEQQAWANTLLTYMNGGYGSSGGPTFTGNQQPIHGSWWVAGQKNGQMPDGTQTAWGTGNYRPGQQAVTDLMLFTKPSSAATVTTPPVTTPPVTTPPVTIPPTVTVSKEGTIVSTVGPMITTATKDTWALNSAGQIVVNGTADSTTSKVSRLLYFNGRVWQENSGLSWWSKAVPSDSWTPNNGTTTETQLTAWMAVLAGR